MNQWDTCFLDMKVIKTTTKIAPVHQHTTTPWFLCDIFVFYIRTNKTLPLLIQSTEKKKSLHSTFNNSSLTDTHIIINNTSNSQKHFFSFSLAHVLIRVSPPPPPHLFSKKAPLFKQNNRKSKRPHHNTQTSPNSMKFFYSINCRANTPAAIDTNKILTVNRQHLFVEFVCHNPSFKSYDVILLF